VLDHSALLYDSDERFVEYAAPFLREGVERGEAVYAPLSDRQERLLRAALGAAGDEVSFLRAEEFYASPIRTIHNHQATMADCPTGTTIRALGELPWDTRSGTAVREWARMEALFEYVFPAGGSASVVCAYDRRRQSDAMLDAIRASHPRPHGGDYVASERRLQCLLRAPLPEPRGPIVETEIGLAPDSVRHFACARAREAGLAPELVAHLELAVGEVAVNAVRYAGGLRLRLRLWTEDRFLVCEVSDHGPGFDDVLAGVLEPPADAERGWGLWIAHQLCDYVETRSWESGTVIRLHLRQRPPFHLRGIRA
jgi:anti-sigma regulatory factor (Ser/Thr protein kinase)